MPLLKKVTNYFFERIELNPDEELDQVGVLHFIRKSLLNTQGRTTECCFLIKQLVGCNDGIFAGHSQGTISLSDVFVKTQELSDLRTEKDTLYATISFTFQGIKYWLRL